MPNYRRLYLPGSTYFFTVVTEGRRPLFDEPAARGWLRAAIRGVREELPFELVAICLLPEHLHCLWTLPPEDSDFSRRWGKIKGEVSKAAVRAGMVRRSARPARARKRGVDFWQQRFWEHWIRDELDFKNHLDYIHYNPVKHGLVQRPIDWSWSSFRRFVRMGWYEEDWGSTEPENVADISGGE